MKNKFYILLSAAIMSLYGFSAFAYYDERCHHEYNPPPEPKPTPTPVVVTVVKTPTVPQVKIEPLDRPFVSFRDTDVKSIDFGYMRAPVLVYQDKISIMSPNEDKHLSCVNQYLNTGKDINECEK